MSIRLLFTEKAPPSIKQLSYADICALQGKYVSGEGTDLEVCLIDFAEQQFYLKSSHRESLIKRLPHMLRNKTWCSVAEQEARTLMQLNAKGFSTIPLIAAGTFFKRGVPVSGFMLSEAVNGESLDTVLKSSDDEQNWLNYGKLVARLHNAGCSEALRAKDVLVHQGAWMLLDRSKPLLKKLSTQRCKQSIERMIYRNQRDGITWLQTQRESFIAAYVEAAGPLSKSLLETLILK